VVPRGGRNPTDVFVGARVRELRKQHGMSQSTLAEGLGLTFQQVQKYENAANRISASRLTQIAEILGVTPPYFFEGAPRVAGTTGKKDSGSDHAFIARFIASDDGLALVKAFRRIDDSTLRRAVVRMVEAIADQ
jgi:transcriptional regulator with XRE-family HTH domain